MILKQEPQNFLKLAAVAAVVGAIVCYFPYTHLSVLQGEINDLQSKVNSSGTVKSQLETSQAQLVTDQTQLAHLEANVSSSGYVPSLLIDLDKYGKSCGMNVTGVRPKVSGSVAPTADAKAAKPYDMLSIDITGSGNFASVEKFVSGLTQFPKVVAVYSMSVMPHAKNNAGEEGPTNLLDISITLNAYVFKNGTTPTTSTVSTPVVGGSPGTVTPGSASPTPSPSVAAPNVHPIGIPSSTPAPTHSPAPGKPVPAGISPLHASIKQSPSKATALNSTLNLNHSNERNKSF